MDHAKCLGGTQIVVDNKFWRIDSNATSVVQCPRPESCKGGYDPNQEHPIKCQAGYTGLLWTEWEITKDNKYQRVSTYEWNKCPDPVVNFIRIWIVVLISFAFLMLLIVTTIRKTRENQTSILLRIMTNYIQLITASLGFDLKYPSQISNFFGISDSIGSASDTYLSFDCLIENAEMKSFTPSNEVFKVFLTSFLPIILILVISVIWLILFLINKRKFPNIKRYNIITVVWVIFLLHPTIATSSFGLFECIDIGESRYRMRMHMDYLCYSPEHLTWVALIGLPNILFWVIACPMLVFVILYKNRNHLEHGPVRSYLLLVYQGLKRKTFYWEFINTCRKLLILSFDTILSLIPVNYRALLAVWVLIGIVRLQLYLSPYQNGLNNNLEIKAIIAGMITILWGILFNANSEGSSLSGFVDLGSALLVLANAWFISEWIYLFLVSLKYKSEAFNIFLRFYGMILCKRHDNIAQSRDSGNFCIIIYLLLVNSENRHKKVKDSETDEVNNNDNRVQENKENIRVILKKKKGEQFSELDRLKIEPVGKSKSKLFKYFIANDRLLQALEDSNYRYCDLSIVNQFDISDFQIVKVQKHLQ
jgi:hypothetical protein